MTGTHVTVLATAEANAATARGQRLIRDTVTEWAGVHDVDGLAMEEPGRVFVRREFRDRTGSESIGLRIAVGQGERRGEIRARAFDAGVPILPCVPASSVKAAVGVGGLGSEAGKQAVIRAVGLRYGVVTSSDHVADAVAVAVAALKRLFTERMAKG
jgi:Holliday junction resolvasome RuvABC endonuclease subunit